MAAGALSLESVRESLVRQEDTIVFSLIERAQHPLNSPAYDATPGLDGSLVEVLFKETEVLHAKVKRHNHNCHHLIVSQMAGDPFPSLPPSISLSLKACKLGRFEYEEENAFFPDDMPQPLITYNNHPQALSKRIHYGKFVAEVKYQDAPQDYEPAIRAQDRDALMRLLTFEKVEEMVKKRVANKAKVFGQEITSDSTEGTGKQKIDPSVASLIYEEWVMPLTKLVEVEYLLRRLD